MESAIKFFATDEGVISDCDVKVHDIPAMIAALREVADELEALPQQSVH